MLLTARKQTKRRANRSARLGPACGIRILHRAAVVHKAKYKYLCVQIEPTCQSTEQRLWPLRCFNIIPNTAKKKIIRRTEIKDSFLIECQVAIWVRQIQSYYDEQEDTFLMTKSVSSTKMVTDSVLFSFNSTSPDSSSNLLSECISK